MARPKTAARACALMVRVDKQTKERIQAIADDDSRSVDFVLREIITAHFAAIDAASRKK